MKINILIVDDVQSNLISLEGLLETMGEDYNIIKASSGSEALEKTLEQKIDLIILDIQMPEMDGFEVAQLLKGNKKTEDIPVVFLTAAFKEEEFVKKGFKIGAVDYLSKPVNENQLINRISLYAKLIKSVEENREKDKRLSEAVKMADMGEMIGNIAHQWRQPLSAISTAASGMRVSKEFDTLTDESFYELTDGIMRNTKFLTDTINTFTSFINEQHELKEVVLQDRIDTTLDIIYAALEDNNIKIINNIDYNNPIKMTMVVGELSQVLINILTNAKDVLVKNEIKNSWIKLDLISKDDKIIITIEDNGGGIADDIMPKIFEPYFTTKHQSQGAGLGLNVSYKIVTEILNGKLYAKNTDNGAKFYIELPLS